MRNLSDWRSVRVWELGVERELRQRHILPLHGFFIGLTVLGLMWVAAFAQFHAMGSESLALRYILTLGVGYLGYLLVLRIWAWALLRGESLSVDLPFNFGSSHSTVGGDAAAPAGHLVSGGGGDFGGGGASAEFGAPDLGAVDAGAGSAIGDVAGGALQVAAASEEGAVVVVPVVVVFLVGLAVVFGAGALMFLYFGWDVLLAVAVEVAFGYASARTAIRVAREGWLSAAVRLTWKPLLGAIFCAVLLGGVIDFFLPTAHSLPQAVHILRAAKWH